MLIVSLLLLKAVTWNTDIGIMVDGRCLELTEEISTNGNVR